MHAQVFGEMQKLAKRTYSKTCVKRSLSKRQKKCFQDLLSLNAGLKYYRMLSGRVFDSRPKDRGFEPHRRHCAVSLSKTH